MDDDEFVLSDVHVFTDNLKPTESYAYNLIEEIPISTDKVLSRFAFHMYDDIDEAKVEDKKLTDDDGDFIIERRKPRKEVIIIEHAMSTHLQDVGLQVWLGSLLLCDYIIYARKQFEKKTVLELGCGLGLCSIVASAFADTIICTDVTPEILELCNRNLQRNVHLHSSKNTNKTLTRKLDWTKDDNFVAKSDCHWNWTENDLDKLKSTTIILAADVIYDDKLTAAFFKTVEKLMSHSPVELLISLEKRLNFTLSDLDIACPAYNFFRGCLDKLSNSISESGIGFNIEQIAVNFPQCFQYDRTKYLELWKVSSFR